MGTTREYEFFVVTSEPQQPEGMERSRIRRLVMRNVFESKASGPQTNALEYHSASTVMAEKHMKSRFRLSGLGQNNNKGSRGKTFFVKQTRPMAQGMTCGATAARYTTKDTSGSRRSSKIYEAQIELRMKQHQDMRFRLNTNPNTHRFDSFDVLPIPGTPELDTLFNLCKELWKISSI